MIKSANRIALEAMRAEMEKQAFLGDVWNGIKGGVGALYDAGKDAVGGVVDTVKNVGRGAYNAATANLKNLGGIGGSIGSGIAQMFGATETADAMRGWANDQFKGAREDYGDMFDAGKGALGGIGRSLWGGARLAVPGITAGVGAFNGVVNGAEQRGAQQAQQAQPQQPAQPQGIADHVNKQIAKDQTGKVAPAAAPVAAPAAAGVAAGANAAQTAQAANNARATAQAGNAMMNGGRPSRSSMANPQPNPANARATAQAGNAMMNGGRPSRSSMANPQPSPANARAAAQAGNSMMNGGRASRSSMAANPAPAAAPVAAPQATPQAAPQSAIQSTPQAAPAGYNPAAITRAQMRQYSRYTGARNMNSDMDRWKTYQAMNGNRNASNRDYYAARRNGFR